MANMHIRSLRRRQSLRSSEARAAARGLRAALLERDADIHADAVVAVPVARGSQGRDGGLEFAAEHLHCSVLAAAYALAPQFPGLEDELYRRGQAGLDAEAVVDEGFHGRGQQLKFFERFLRALGLDEVSALAQPVIAIEAPVEDAGQ